MAACPGYLGRWYGRGEVQGGLFGRGGEGGIGSACVWSGVTRELVGVMYCVRLGVGGSSRGGFGMRGGSVAVQGREGARVGVCRKEGRIHSLGNRVGDVC